MLTAVGGGICLKTLVALCIMLSILGQCEMSFYPGKFINRINPFIYELNKIYEKEEVKNAIG